MAPNVTNLSPELLAMLTTLAGVLSGSVAPGAQDGIALQAQNQAPMPTPLPAPLPAPGPVVAPPAAAMGVTAATAAALAAIIRAASATTHSFSGPAGHPASALGTSTAQNINPAPIFGSLLGSGGGAVEMQSGVPLTFNAARGGSKRSRGGNSMTWRLSPIDFELAVTNRKKAANLLATTSLDFSFPRADFVRREELIEKIVGHTWCIARGISVEHVLLLNSAATSIIWDDVLPMSGGNNTLYCFTLLLGGEVDTAERLANLCRLEYPQERLWSFLYEFGQEPLMQARGVPYQNVLGSSSADGAVDEHPWYTTPAAAMPLGRRGLPPQGMAADGRRPAAPAAASAAALSARKLSKQPTVARPPGLPAAAPPAPLPSPAAAPPARLVPMLPAARALANHDAQERSVRDAMIAALIGGEPLSDVKRLATPACRDRSLLVDAAGIEASEENSKVEEAEQAARLRPPEEEGEEGAEGEVGAAGEEGEEGKEGEEGEEGVEGVEGEEGVEGGEWAGEEGEEGEEWDGEEGDEGDEVHEGDDDDVEVPTPKSRSGRPLAPRRRYTPPFPGCSQR